MKINSSTWMFSILFITGCMTAPTAQRQVASPEAPAAEELPKIFEDATQLNQESSDAAVTKKMETMHELSQIARPHSAMVISSIEMATLSVEFPTAEGTMKVQSLAQTLVKSGKFAEALLKAGNFDEEGRELIESITYSNRAFAELCFVVSKANLADPKAQPLINLLLLGQKIAQGSLPAEQARAIADQMYAVLRILKSNPHYSSEEAVQRVLPTSVKSMVTTSSWTEWQAADVYSMAKANEHAIQAGDSTDAHSANVVSFNGVISSGARQPKENLIFIRNKHSGKVVQSVSKGPYTASQWSIRSFIPSADSRQQLTLWGLGEANPTDLEAVIISSENRPGETEALAQLGVPVKEVHIETQGPWIMSYDAESDMAYLAANGAKFQRSLFGEALKPNENVMKEELNLALTRLDAKESGLQKNMQAQTLLVASYAGHTERAGVMKQLQKDLQANEELTQRVLPAYRVLLTSLQEDPLSQTVYSNPSILILRYYLQEGVRQNYISARELTPAEVFQLLADVDHKLNFTPPR
jgi:hypothetical protein